MTQNRSQDSERNRAHDHQRLDVRTKRDREQTVDRQERHEEAERQASERLLSLALLSLGAELDLGEFGAQRGYDATEDISGDLLRRR